MQPVEDGQELDGRAEVGERLVPLPGRHLQRRHDVVLLDGDLGGPPGEVAQLAEVAAQLGEHTAPFGRRGVGEAGQSGADPGGEGGGARVVGGEEVVVVGGAVLGLVEGAQQALAHGLPYALVGGLGRDAGAFGDVGDDGGEEPRPHGHRVEQVADGPVQGTARRRMPASVSRRKNSLPDSGSGAEVGGMPTHRSVRSAVSAAGSPRARTRA